jgi:ABC-type Fe3+/spermidine/putrescine transport system ATPase subunit
VRDARVWSLRPEHIRLDSGGEVQVQGVVQAVQYQGATRIELKLANGDKLLVSQANSDGGMVSSAPQTGQTVLASWSRSAMVPLEQGAEMTMVIPRAPSGRLSGLFWRSPSLGLFLLLLGR